MYVVPKYLLELGPPLGIEELHDKLCAEDVDELEAIAIAAAGSLLFCSVRVWR